MRGRTNDHRRSVHEPKTIYPQISPMAADDWLSTRLRRICERLRHLRHLRHLRMIQWKQRRA
jgi:hypothetical protein